MTNHQLILYFKQRINYFDNVNESDFDVLSKIDNNLFNGDEEYVVTPLLKQISEYSTILKTFSSELSENISLELLKNILEFITNCSYYINRLISVGYNHPSVILNVYMDDICSLYNCMYKTSKSISLSGTFDYEKEGINTDILSTYFDQFSDIVYGDIDNNFALIANRIYNADIISEKDILLLLKSYSISVFKSLALISGVQQYTMADSNIILANSKSEVLYLFDIVTLATHLKNKTKNQSLISQINKLLDEYNLYSSFRYHYLRENYKEQIYLQKCKIYRNK